MTWMDFMHPKPHLVPILGGVESTSGRYRPRSDHHGYGKLLGMQQLRWTTREVRVLPWRLWGLWDVHPAFRWNTLGKKMCTHSNLTHRNNRNRCYCKIEQCPEPCCNVTWFPGWSIYRSQRRSNVSPWFFYGDSRKLLWLKSLSVVDPFRSISLFIIDPFRSISYPFLYH